MTLTLVKRERIQDEFLKLKSERKFICKFTKIIRRKYRLVIIVYWYLEIVKQELSLLGFFRIFISGTIYRRGDVCFRLE